jgi:hypothetical protein
MSTGFGCSSEISMVPNMRLCNGEYRPGQLCILSSRVAPDTTDADVHALCTKPIVLKMKESRTSSRNHRTVRWTTETCTNNKFVSTLIWKCLDRLYWFIFDLWWFNATFNNISAISWRPVCMSDEGFNYFSGYQFS